MFLLRALGGLGGCPKHVPTQAELNYFLQSRLRVWIWTMARLQPRWWMKQLPGTWGLSLCSGFFMLCSSAVYLTGKPQPNSSLCLCLAAKARYGNTNCCQQVFIPAYVKDSCCAQFPSCVHPLVFKKHINPQQQGITPRDRGRGDTRLLVSSCPLCLLKDVCVFVFGI